MSIRLGILALVVLATGCARQQAGQVAQGAHPAPMGMSNASPPLALAGPRQARLPDRGELVAYPGRVQRADGAYTWFRSDVSEAHALRSIADGHLRLTTPDGRPLDIRYDRHVEHPSGDWTWIGHLPGEEGAQTIITFGERAVFGSIAQPDGKPPLRLTMRDGVSWLVETDPRKVAGIINAATRPTKPDYHIVRREDLPAARNGIRSAGAPIAAAAPPATTSAATATSANTVDLLVGYTAGFVTAQGSTSAALTRINYLVDVANAALANSQVTAQVRLVHAMQVNYTDLNTNDTALEQLSGYKSGVGPVTPNAAFSALRSARETYGADLVSLVRPFKDPEQDSCGLAWLLGGGKQGIQANAGWDDLAYSVIGDGEDVGSDGKTYFCRDETLAHEMGHNEGSAHDRETAKGDDGVLNDPDDYGAFTYSFGYKSTTSVSVGGRTYPGFYTVMAYGDTGTYGYRVFSNPRITFCGNHACGTTTYEDNARSLSQTIPVVVTFRATKVPLGGYAPADLNGDGKSDLLWYNPSPNRFAFWLMNGATIASASPAFTIASGYVPIATGDFNGDGLADMVWTDGQTLMMRLGQADGSGDWQAVGSYPATWKTAGVADVNGDGKSDLLWYNPSPNRFGYWLMSGATIASTSPAASLATGYVPIATGDFNGDGLGDMVWTNGQGMSMRLATSGGGATWLALGNYPAGWKSAGSVDLDGDGKSDLLWYNTSTNTFAYWSMSGATIAYASPATSLAAGYVPIATGDFNGDGYGDMLWTNGQSLSMRFGLAGRNSTWQLAGSYPAGWKVASQLL